MPEEVTMCKTLPANDTELLFNKSTQDLTCNRSTPISTSSAYSENMLVAADEGSNAIDLPSVNSEEILDYRNETSKPIGNSSSEQMVECKNKCSKPVYLAPNKFQVYAIPTNNAEGNLHNYLNKSSL